VRAKCKGPLCEVNLFQEARNQYLVTLEIYNASNADFAVYSLEVANLMGISKKDVRFVPGELCHCLLFKVPGCFHPEIFLYVSMTTLLSISRIKGRVVTYFM